MNRELGRICAQAYGHATRLGCPFLGAEHFLLALAAADHPAAEVLREHGVTPQGVEAEVIRLAGAGLFADLDADALAVVGIDVDAVRSAAEASFSPGALTRAASPGWRRRSRFDPRRRSGATRAGVFLPHGPMVNQALVGARGAARADGADQADVEHFALALLAATEGPVPLILSRLGVSGPALRTAILAR